ncbi:MAG TPA: hypothetical protein VE262_22345 [Blastocatellia bacterium]|nr:hypothetical protein [Blastocatellia bacterium]
MKTGSIRAEINRIRSLNPLRGLSPVKSLNPLNHLRRLKPTTARRKPAKRPRRGPGTARWSERPAR